MRDKKDETTRNPDVSESAVERLVIHDTVDFNVNHYVYVKLTSVGKAEHRRQHDELCEVAHCSWEYTPPVEDEEGWSKWQMHSLMNRFGHLMSLGFDPPFETTIRIEIKV
jgi:hypothetical protein